MKKLIVSIGAAVAICTTGYAAGSAFGQPASQVASTTLTANTPALLSSNNIVIDSVTILSTNFTTVSFYDCGRTNSPYFGTNAVTSAFVSTAQWQTNIVSSFVGYNGYTNYYTNSAWATYLVTNSAATNVLSPQGTFAVIPNVVATYSAQMLFSQGASVVCPTNATVIYYYRLNR